MRFVPLASKTCEAGERLVLSLPKIDEGDGDVVAIVSRKLSHVVYKAHRSAWDSPETLAISMLVVNKRITRSTEKRNTVLKRALMGIQYVGAIFYSVCLTRLRLW